MIKNATMLHFLAFFRKTKSNSNRNSKKTDSRSKIDHAPQLKNKISHISWQEIHPLILHSDDFELLKSEAICIR